MRWQFENAFDADIAWAGALYNIPVWVIKATAAKESAFNPKAFAGVTDGRGLMQITAATARGLGYSGDIGNDTTRTGGLYQPRLSVQLAAKLFRELRDRYPAAPWDHIYSAYRAGRIRTDLTGQLIAKDEQYVVGWRHAAEYFNPGWREEPPPGPSPGPGQPAPGPAVRYGMTLTGRQWLLVAVLVLLGLAIWKGET